MKVFKSCIFFLMISCFFSLVVWAEGNRPALSKPYLEAPVFVGGASSGSLWIFPRSSRSEFMVQAAPLMSLFDEMVEPTIVQGLKKKVRSEGVLSLTDLETHGMSVRFDEASLELFVDIPMKYRIPKELSVLEKERGKGFNLRPSLPSGYLNMRAAQGFTYGHDLNDRQDFVGQLDFVENIQGYVFESGYDYLENHENAWRRQDTRIRYDNEEDMIRWTLGDLTLRSMGFQRSPSMAGLSLVREFSIKPYRTLRPLNKNEVIIKRPSIVEVYVNGFLLSQKRVAPGVFNIREFPLASGQTAVKIKVIDDLGQEELYDFSVLFENTLLNDDESEFSYSIGTPWQEVNRNRNYDSERWLFSFYHRYGVSNDITLGINYQMYDEQSLFGQEASTITPLGYLSLELGQSYSQYWGNGHAQKIRYRSLDNYDGIVRPVVFIAEMELRNGDFAPVQQDTFQPSLADYKRRWELQMNYRHLNRFYFNLGGEYQQRQALEDRKIYRANLTVPLSSRTRLEFALSRTEDENKDDRGMISFYWNDISGTLSSSAYFDTYKNTQNISFNRNNRSLYDDYRFNSSLSSSDDNQLAQVTGEYLWQPASVRLDHSSNFYSGRDQSTTSIGLNSGVAWVGSKFAFTQPINDSFILVAANNLPEGAEISINPNSIKDDAKIIGGKRESVVLRNQISYYVSSLNVDSTQLPLGYLIDREFYQTQPTYKSGILINLDIQHKVMIRGRFVFKDGSPLKYAAGDIFNEKGELIDNTFFTSQSGAFVVEGLEPGVYIIKTSHPELAALKFVVTSSKEGVLNLGDIVVEGKGAQ